MAARRVPHVQAAYVAFHVSLSPYPYTGSASRPAPRDTMRRESVFTAVHAYPALAGGPGFTRWRIPGSGRWARVHSLTPPPRHWHGSYALSLAFSMGVCCSTYNACCRS